MENQRNFIPPFYLRNSMLQTFLSSSSARNLGTNKMLEKSKMMILELDDGVRLKGYYSRNDQTAHNKTVILLHGWEGSSDSAYILSTGKTLFNNGFDVFRLNFRDHGDSHRLNKGPFLGTLTQEAADAVKSISEMAKNNPVYLVGFSMGGNFALRIAHYFSTNPIHNLKQIVAINPPLDPLESTINIDKTSLIKKYFLKKWKKSLCKKQSAFPDIYDFSDVLTMDNCLEITDLLVKRYSDYDDYVDYFSRYTISKDYFNKITIPTLIITSHDDPIIPVDDFLHIESESSSFVDCIINQYGGHCGYITGIGLKSWYQDIIVRMFNNESDTQ